MPLRDEWHEDAECGRGAVVECWTQDEYLHHMAGGRPCHPSDFLLVRPALYREAAQRCDDLTCIAATYLPPGSEHEHEMRMALRREGRGLALDRSRRQRDWIWLTPRLKHEGQG